MKQAIPASLRGDLVLELSAMIDGEDVGYACLGSLCPMEGEAPNRAVTLKKHISVYNLGRYTKRLTTPMYLRQAMTDLSVRSAQHRFEAANCKGVLCATLRCHPDGYVVRSCGGHRFCLPVYDSRRLSGSFYRIKGYMLTEDGYLAVAARRWILWLLLALFAGCSFVLGYLMLQYGAQGAWNELARFLGTLTTNVKDVFL